MTYLAATQEHLSNLEKAEYLKEFTKAIREAKLLYHGDPEKYRDTVVGLQAEWDRVYNQVCTEGSVAIIITHQVATPFTHDKRNIHEIVEAKRSTVEARIETSREMLQTGKPVIIASPREAWEAIKGTSQASVWKELSEKYKNLTGVAVNISKRLNGALNIVGDEAVSINFTQAQQASPTVSDHFVVAGDCGNKIVSNRVSEIIKPLKKANNPEVNRALDKLAL